VIAVLDARERLYHIQQELLCKWPTVVEIGLCLPGGYLAYPWENLFAEACSSVKAKLLGIGEDIAEEVRIETAAGPSSFLAVRGDGRSIKREMIALEEHSPRGRLWDVDVITVEGIVDRQVLGIRPRACLVCSEEAHFCRKMKRHELGEVMRAAWQILGG